MKPSYMGEEDSDEDELEMPDVEIQTPNTPPLKVDREVHRKFGLNKDEEDEDDDNDPIEELLPDEIAREHISVSFSGFNISLSSSTYNVVELTGLLLELKDKLIGNGDNKRESNKYVG
jgi:hypothetical protein